MSRGKGGAGQKLAVIGWPAAHSRSPLIHNHWLEQSGREAVYQALDVPPVDLPPFIHALTRHGFAGVNVTIPHKQTACAALGLAHDLAPEARRLGAVNVIRAGPEGLTGYNTDGAGFLAGLREAAPQWRASSGAPAVMVGAGGAARAIALALEEAGLAELRVINRSLDHIRALAGAGGRAMRVDPVDLADPAGCRRALEGAGLLVNASSLGMTGAPGLTLPLEALPLAAPVADIVYAPLQTPLLAAAGGRGHETVDGLGMLLHQAAASFAIWFGERPEISTALRRAVARDLAGA